MVVVAVEVEVVVDVAGVEGAEVAAGVTTAKEWVDPDLDLGHGFHATKQGVRYTLSEPARREVPDRLLALNHERYEEEVRQGLREGPGRGGGGGGKRRGRRKGGEELGQGTLFEV